MASVWGELKRRNVVKVGVAYAIVAWLLVQIIVSIEEPLNLPDWTDTLVIVLLGFGLAIAILLAWAYELTPDGIRAAGDVQPTESVTRVTGQRLNYFIVGLLVIAVGFLVIDQYVVGPEINGSPPGAVEEFRTAFDSTAPAPRYSIILGSTESMTSLLLLSTQMALSRDGRRIAYAAMVYGELQLFIRDLDQLVPRAIPDTAGALAPFFSPDGQWIAFAQQGGGFRKIPASGGTPQTLAADRQFETSGFWTEDGTILFTDATDGALHRVSAEGGISQPLGPFPDEGEIHSWPHPLPGGNEILITAGADSEARTARIALLNTETGEVRTVIEQGYNARYLPTGHIAFIRDASLWAVPFDLSRLEIVGEEVPVVQGVETASSYGSAAYSFSDDGRLIYLPGIDTEAEQSQTLVWVDHDGNEEPLALPRSYRWADVSPSGERIAVGIDEGGNEDIWIYDLARTSLSRLTFDPAVDSLPRWAPDGERVVFSSTRGDGGLWWRAADGTGQAEQIETDPLARFPDSFSPDGSQLVYAAGPPFDLYVLSLEGDGTAQPLTSTDHNELAGAISPDGSWIAYHSNEHGRLQVFVRPFPNVEDGIWQISREGGAIPVWSPDGRELYYRWGGGGLGSTVFAASIESEPDFSAGTPSLLFYGTYVGAGPQSGLDISADGERFLLLKDTARVEQVPGQTVLVAVESWFDEVNRRVPRSE
jgi:Tol biopolymer transport system component